MTDHDFFDELETRDPAAREADFFSRLPAALAAAKARAPGWAAHLEGIEPAAITDRSSLATLPVLRKSQLIRLQQQNPPFGGFATCQAGAMARLFLSPGPIADPEGPGDNWWRSARALFAAGVRSGDIVHNAFAYHLTPGGFILDAAARALGCAVIPAGVGNTQMQVETMARFAPAVYTGTPDYLQVLLDKADEMGVDVSSVTKALVSGGALFPAMREAYKERGIAVLQCYATADLGVIAYESAAMDGMIVDEGVWVEIVRPGSGDPVPDGEVGEVVVTSLNPDYPMFRFATGDLSAILPGRSPCGRTNTRIQGWLGRADQTTKIKGMFVHPEQVDEIVKAHDEIGRARLVVGHDGKRDVMTLHVECAAGASDDLASRITATMQQVTKLRGEVVIAAPGALANDGKVIADERRYD
ncbi:MAG TPA: phenylacetate--CoA ligase family protein [Rhodobacteraceae bacterium]|nr:phenylacetate--CoA ligase family protein [Paracoccaceae bacterium]